MNEDTTNQPPMTASNTLVIHVRKDTPEAVKQATMNELAKRYPGIVYFVVGDDGEDKLKAMIPA